MYNILHPTYKQLYVSVSITALGPWVSSPLHGKVFWGGGVLIDLDRATTAIYHYEVSVEEFAYFASKAGIAWKLYIYEEL